MENLLSHYKSTIIPALKTQFGYSNVFEIPRMMKVTLNVGVGRNAKEANFIESVEKTLRAITGQKPVRTKAKKSVAGFKIREGQVVGVMVTLRKKRMNDFVEKLIHYTLPRVRDFRGIDSSIVDGHGNLNLGFKEHISFPEVGSDEIDRVHGLELSITSTAKTHEEGVALFKAMGFPFKS